MRYQQMAALTLALGLPFLAHASDGHIGTGQGSYYSNEFAGKRTASGEIFNPKALTAAHRTVAFGSKVRVTNLANGKDVVVRINDRGPWKKGRIIDISYAAAKKIGMHHSGTARVRLNMVSK
jgi:rare lipoprotein A